MLLILLLIVALALVAGGFFLHWLFLIAAVVALIWLISLFAGGLGRGSRI